MVKVWGKDCPSIVLLMLEIIMTVVVVMLAVLVVVVTMERIKSIDID